jgi:N-hydroxyarylamine O-acetyltransferase
VDDIGRYLNRIGYAGERFPNAVNLAKLQMAHLLAVPFENLDVYARTGVHVGLDWSIPKIVDRHRGGWCFELNGAFAWLLEGLGYDVTLHSAQVELARRLGPAFDHLALIVSLDGRRLLVDVGFGDSSLAPLDIDNTAPQRGVVRRSRINHLPRGDAIELFDEQPDGSWNRQYRLDLEPCTLAEFEPRSRELQTAPGLPWTTGPFATKATPTGRLWLLADRVKVRSADGALHETPVSNDEWDNALFQHFQMTAAR